MRRYLSRESENSRAAQCSHILQVFNIASNFVLRCTQDNYSKFINAIDLVNYATNRHFQTKVIQSSSVLKLVVLFMKAVVLIQGEPGPEN